MSKELSMGTQVLIALEVLLGFRENFEKVSGMPVETIEYIEAWRNLTQAQDAFACVINKLHGESIDPIHRSDKHSRLEAIRERLSEGCPPELDQGQWMLEEIDLLRALVAKLKRRAKLYMKNEMFTAELTPGMKLAGEEITGIIKEEGR